MSHAPFARRLLTVTGNDELGAYRVLRVAAPSMASSPDGDPDGALAQPGQFAMLAAAERWGGGEDERPYLPRAFSVARQRDGEAHFLLEDVGPGTRRLCELRAGDSCGRSRRSAVASAPAGRISTGAARCSSAAASASPRSRSSRTRSPMRARSADRTSARLPRPRARRGRRAADHARVATDDGSVGHHGLVTELLAAELDRDPHAVVYACGPAGMLEGVRALCERRATPAQLALEAGMACGFGACFGCVVPRRGGGYLRVCVDGPVIDAAELEHVDAHAGAPA